MERREKKRRDGENGRREKGLEWVVRGSPNHSECGCTPAAVSRSLCSVLVIQTRRDTMFHASAPYHRWSHRHWELYFYMLSCRSAIHACVHFVRDISIWHSLTDFHETFVTVAVPFYHN